MTESWSVLCWAIHIKGLSGASLHPIPRLGASWAALHEVEGNAFTRQYIFSPFPMYALGVRNCSREHKNAHFLLFAPPLHRDVLLLSNCSPQCYNTIIQAWWWQNLTVQRCSLCSPHPVFAERKLHKAATSFSPLPGNWWAFRGDVL